MNTIDHITAELRLLYRARQQHLAGQHRHEPGATQQWAELVHRYDMLLHRAANMLDIPAPPSLGARCYRSEQRAELEARLAAAGLHVDTQPETARCGPAMPPTTCARPGCPNPVRHNTIGRPAIYCSPTCRPSWRSPSQRRVTVEIGHPDISPDGRPARRVWAVTLRRGTRSVVVANGLGWPSAHALAQQLEHILHGQPVPPTGAAID